MKKLFRRFKIRQRIAACMAVILTTMAFLPYIPENMISFADYAQAIEPAAQPSWDSSDYGAEANSKNYIPTGLMYENKVFN